MNRVIFFGLAIVLCAGVYCCKTLPTQTTQPPYIFIIENDTVLTEEFVYQLEKNSSIDREPIDQKEVEEYLQLFINFKLKVKEAESLGYDTTQSFKSEYNQYLDQLYEPYLSEKTGIENLVKEAYQRMLEEIDASHILLKLDQYASPKDTLKVYNRMMEIREEALGETSFEDLVIKYSEEPNTNNTKGRLGYFSAFRMVYPFETAAYQTSVGEISKPVRTQFGYHLIKVNNRIPARGTVQIAHIMLRFKPAQTSSDSLQQSNRIFEIHQMLNNGADWDEVCRKYSEDINSKDKGGLLPEFGPGRMIPSFDQHAFNLSEPGQISDPFQSRFGWHIIKLVKKTPIPPFEQVRKTIEARVSRDSRSMESKKRLIARLKKQNDFIQHDDIVNEIISMADSTLIKGAWEVDISAIQKDVLFSIGGKSYTNQQFLEYVNQNQKKVNNYAPEYYLSLLYDNYVNDLLIEYEKENLEEKSIAFRMLKKEYRDGILLFEIMQDKVWAKATSDSTALFNYYQKNKEDYRTGEMVNALIISGVTDEDKQDLRTYLDTHYQDLIASDSAFNSFKNNPRGAVPIKSALPLVIEKNIYKKGNNLVDTVPWSEGMHWVKNDSLNHVICIGEVINSTVSPFESVRGLVVADYQKQLEDQWVMELRNKYQVLINEPELDSVYGKYH